MDIKDTTAEKSIKDNPLQSVLLKLSKLATAAYMVTAFIDDKDPVKWKIREKCLSLMSDTEILNEQKIIGHIDRMVYLLDIVLVNELASRMNFSLLKQEYLALRGQVTKSTLLNLTERRRSPGGGASPSLSGPSGASNSSNKAPEASSSRQGAILQKLKNRGGWLSITEIKETLPDWSAKIIQRELQALVLAGKVKRIGEKRWSRYAVD